MLAAQGDHRHVVVQPACGRIGRQGAQRGDESSFVHASVR
jgi:hypothetical protein